MKPSNVLLCLIPTALATEYPTVSPDISLPNVTPPVSLPEVQAPSSADTYEVKAQARQANAPADVNADMPDWPQPSIGVIGLGALSKTSETKVLRVRSEGTLGQTPWIGMGIGLTCTALAAVMLG